MMIVLIQIPADSIGEFPFSTPCPASNEIINKNFSLHILPLAKFWPLKIKLSSVNFYFLKERLFQLRNYLCLVDMEVPSDQVGISSRGKKRAHCRKFENSNQIEEKWSALQNHHAALILSFISDLTLLPTSMAPPSLLTYYTTASNGAKHWAQK